MPSIITSHPINERSLSLERRQRTLTLERSANALLGKRKPFVNKRFSSPPSPLSFQKTLLAPQLDL